MADVSNVDPERLDCSGSDVVDCEPELTDLEPLFFGLHTLSPTGEALAERLERLCCSSLAAESCATASRPDNDSVWAYGEVLILPFICLLQEQCRTLSKSKFSKQQFVDLGSGAGKPVLAAATLSQYVTPNGHDLPCEFSHCRGIESLMPLHLEALQALDRCRADFFPDIADVTFECADIRLVPWWRDASIVFCNCVTWPAELLIDIGEGAKNMKSGARLLLVKRQLPLIDVAHFFDVSVAWCDMTWAASVPIWVHERLPN